MIIKPGNIVTQNPHPICPTLHRQEGISNPMQQAGHLPFTVTCKGLQETQAGCKNHKKVIIALHRMLEGGDGLKTPERFSLGVK